MTTHIDTQAAALPARRLSAILSALCTALIILSPTLTLLLLLLNPEATTEGLGLAASVGDTANAGFSVGQRVIIVLVGLLPVVFVTYALVCARRCFQSFVAGEYFTTGVVKGLRGLAAGIALWAVAGWLTTPLMTVLLTLGTEEHRLTINFSQSGVLTLLFAGIIWQIADIMMRAAALAEENSQFV